MSLFCTSLRLNGLLINKFHGMRVDNEEACSTYWREKDEIRKEAGCIWSYVGASQCLLVALRHICVQRCTSPSLSLVNHACLTIGTLYPFACSFFLRIMLRRSGRLRRVQLWVGFVLFVSQDQQVSMRYIRVAHRLDIKLKCLRPLSHGGFLCCCWFWIGHPFVQAVAIQWLGCICAGSTAIIVCVALADKGSKVSLELHMFDEHSLPEYANINIICMPYIMTNNIQKQQNIEL
jgi:hypothetical protein